MQKENIAVVERYLESLRRKDLSIAPLHDDLEFSDPVTGAGKGSEKFRAFLSGFLPGISSVKVLRHVCEGEYVATNWEVDGVFGPIVIFELFRVVDGMIIESHSFYDPRLVLGS